MSRSNSSKRRRAPKPNKLRPVCVATGKHYHGSRRQALGQLNAIRAAGRSSTLPVAVYRCRHCNGWHLTSQEQRPR